MKHVRSGVESLAPCRYVHRVGRAARMGRAGEALLFLLPSEREFTDALQDAGAEVQEVDLMPMLNALPPTGQSQVWSAC